MLTFDKKITFYIKLFTLPKYQLWWWIRDTSKYHRICYTCSSNLSTYDSRFKMKKYKIWKKLLTSKLGKKQKGQQSTETFFKIIPFHPSQLFQYYIISSNKVISILKLDQKYDSSWLGYFVFVQQVPSCPVRDRCLSHHTLISTTQPAVVHRPYQ